mmetsp:Transcript_66767/g.192870  ORF Transcript_66767/g.192870 Transcript_66767/m.192870 type:complete len:321 (+) Transcript_66767:612-1574(+)
MHPPRNTGAARLKKHRGLCQVHAEWQLCEGVLQAGGDLEVPASPNRVEVVGTHCEPSQAETPRADAEDLPRDDARRLSAVPGHSIVLAVPSQEGICVEEKALVPLARVRALGDCRRGARDVAHIINGARRPQIFGAERSMVLAASALRRQGARPDVAGRWRGASAPARRRQLGARGEAVGLRAHPAEDVQVQDGAEGSRQHDDVALSFHTGEDSHHGDEEAVRHEGDNGARLRDPRGAVGVLRPPICCSGARQGPQALRDLESSQLVRRQRHVQPEQRRGDHAEKNHSASRCVACPNLNQHITQDVVGHGQQQLVHTNAH